MSTNQTQTPPASADTNKGGRSNNRQRSARWVGLAGVISACLICGVVWIFLSQSTEVPTPEVSDREMIFQTVGVMQIAESTSTLIPHRYTANVVPRRTSRLGFEASERVIDILVDEGQAVEKGEVLAKQDDAVLRARVSAAAASNAQAEAILAELTQGPRQQTIDATRSELIRLETQVKLADVTLERQKRLRTSNAGSAQEYDAAKFDRAAALAAAESTAHRLAELESGTRKEKLDAQRATVALSKAALDQAYIRLNQTDLVAPFSGRISKRFIDEGQLPSNGEPVLEIIESEHLEVRFGAAAEIAAKLKLGDPIPFSVGDRQYEGILSQISPRIDNSTRTREVIVNLSPEDANQIVAGQTVKIEFALPSNEPGFWLPSEALQPQVRGLWSVMVLENDRDQSDAKIKDQLSIARRDVELLSTWGSWSRVRGTLSGGERVVVQGGARVSPGQKVEAKLIQLTPPWKSASTTFVDTEATNAETPKRLAEHDDNFEVVQ